MTSVNKILSYPFENKCFDSFSSMRLMLTKMQMSVLETCYIFLKLIHSLLATSIWYMEKRLIEELPLKEKGSW